MMRAADLVTVSPGTDRGGRPRNGEETGITASQVSGAEQKKAKRLRAILRAPEVVQAMYREVDDSSTSPARTTRTARLYYVGCRYNREKGDPKDTLRKGNSPRRQVDDAAGRACDRIAREERLSPKTVERAAKMAAHIDQASACGLAVVKWPAALTPLPNPCEHAAREVRTHDDDHAAG